MAVTAAANGVWKFQWLLWSIGSQKIATPYNVQQTCNQGQNPLLTRIDYALIQLDQTRQYWPKRVNYLAVDAAYAKEKFISGAIHYGLQVVSKLRMPTFATSMTGHKKPEVAGEFMMARSISVMSRAWLGWKNWRAMTKEFICIVWWCGMFPSNARFVWSISRTNGIPTNRPMPFYFQPMSPNARRKIWNYTGCDSKLSLFSVMRNNLRACPIVKPEMRMPWTLISMSVWWSWILTDGIFYE